MVGVESEGATIRRDGFRGAVLALQFHALLEHRVGIFVGAGRCRERQNKDDYQQNGSVCFHV